MEIHHIKQVEALLRKYSYQTMRESQPKQSFLNNGPGMHVSWPCHTEHAWGLRFRLSLCSFQISASSLCLDVVFLFCLLPMYPTENDPHPHLHAILLRERHFQLAPHQRPRDHVEGQHRQSDPAVWQGRRLARTSLAAKSTCLAVERWTGLRGPSSLPGGQTAGVQPGLLGDCLFGAYWCLCLPRPLDLVRFASPALCCTWPATVCRRRTWKCQNCCLAFISLSCLCFISTGMLVNVHNKVVAAFLRRGDAGLLPLCPSWIQGGDFGAAIPSKLLGLRKPQGK